MRKKHSNLSADQIRDYRQRLRHALGFYKSKELAGGQYITLTQRDTSLSQISTAARGLGKALRTDKACKKWLEKLKNHLDAHNICPQIEKVVALQLRDKCNISLKDLRDMLWGVPSEYVDKKRFFIKADQAPDNSHLKHLARERQKMKRDLPTCLDTLTVLHELPETKIPRWANPDLAFLVEKLAPLWVTVTGRTWKRTETVDGGKTSYFADWIINVLREAGCGPVTIDQIHEIAKLLKIRK